MPYIVMSDISVKSVSCPRGVSKANFTDPLVKGLVLEVRASGGRTWYLRYVNRRGQRRMLRLGSALELSVQDVIRQLADYRKVLRDGGDPAEEYARALSGSAHVPSFGEFVTNDFLPFIKTYKRSWQCDLSLLNNHILPHFADQAMDQISRRDIQACMAAMRRAKKAPGTCDRVLVLVRHIFNCAIKWEAPGVTTNPGKAVPMFNVDNKRQRFLSAPEMARLHAALLTSDSPLLRYIIAMLLLTGARKREVLDARWPDLDLKQRLWTIPVTKAGRPRHVPISDPVMKLLSRVPRRSDIHWVFPNPATGRPYTSIYYPWATVRKRAGLEDVRLHDLRHSFASMLINNGRSLYEVQHLLGHTQAKTTERYAHLKQETLLEAANCAALGQFS